ncbi:YggS family pyridoxal phosphate-dependent enzyme [Helicobacter winghamensis]|uniref:Pyridoxal phosphate homeostasis protein n=1 Tax=Helicobacter winghamensis TaxID=157268 RepID=A0A2N3PHA4_9HELI|nr:YggS family pyridoxal phosphate-dependent enzyme [Helicobacter winghamensis]PKT79490.1 YggS family pyridoxal phosphate enzyme [Helicobacter winghamensis]PKT79787.1 YggS family pyridoxal phosphate enzyme [Helicobacter winghamensis]PKT79870.1 YggS family pyridoxal phosphate enzyme [Helicobacter winghamensis]QOQ97728.1 YggS family pyridoxal phosphate-dependent enzyme [Helicobacter winghamensis]
MQARLNQNLLEAIERIEKARIAVDRRRIVQLVAVSKYSTQEEIATLYACGQRAFGENKVQDLQQKASALEALPLEWHFIGSLQSNKINALLQLKPYLLQSLHSLELAQALQSRLERENQQLNALLQVNSAKEVSKSGFMPEVALEAYARIKGECKNIKLCGLMSIGAHTEDKALVQKSFELTQNLFSQIKGAEVLSMGMSGDFELAIACGSNCVRLGSTLFK